MKKIAAKIIQSKKFQASKIKAELHILMSRPESDRSLVDIDKEEYLTQLLISLVEQRDRMLIDLGNAFKTDFLRDSAKSQEKCTSEIFKLPILRLIPIGPMVEVCSLRFFSPGSRFVDIQGSKTE